MALNYTCLKWKKRELFLCCPIVLRVYHCFLSLCLPASENGNHFLEHSAVFEALRPPRVLPPLLCLVFKQRRCLHAGRRVLTHPKIWPDFKAISGTIGTCRSVLPRPSPSCPSVSVPLTRLYSSSSLQLLSSQTGLKHWTAAGCPPDVGCEP